MQQLRAKGRCLFPAMTKTPGAAERVGAMTGKRHSKNTPFLGSCHIHDFIEEASLNPVRMTYGFRDTGRNSRIVCMRSGTMLLPGTYSFTDCTHPNSSQDVHWQTTQEAYSFTDCTQEALRHRASYSFKSCPRPENYTPGLRDKVGKR
ncbi:protein STPG4 [Pangasianodon hypophthalmus]|uniref:protein STPG4 n=1 Tax=Pangasianodon hypophthalmus TaxID=310915 RepID=UPI002307452C|nr:protein STPG4 [Pangasianodon hypophthalmus]